MAGSMSIKGTREGLTITLGDGDLATMLDDLEQHLKMQEAFFRGGAVALRAGERLLTQEELARIRDLLNEHEMVLRTVISNNTEVEEATHALGLRWIQESGADFTEGRESRELPLTPRSPASLEGARAILVRRMVRSGQVVRNTGHVIIMGDVNVGAEVIAGGDIIVWGGLYGIAHAGALGDTSAVICALDMSPLQLRIGGQIARPGEEERRQVGVPEVAYVRGDRIVVEAWHKARGV
ncbi:MAG: septum site-determining protein MinC [Chloroflexi bacterium]|nr:septum site-determining protein MinC [Chloroflexota bacterium]